MKGRIGGDLKYELFSQRTALWQYLTDMCTVYGSCNCCICNRL